MVGSPMLSVSPVEFVYDFPDFIVVDIKENRFPSDMILFAAYKDTDPAVSQPLSGETDIG